MSRKIRWVGPIFHFCLLLFKFLHFCLHYSLIHVCTLFSFSWAAAATWRRKNRKRKRKIKITIYEVGVSRIHLRWFFNSLQSYWHDDDCQASIFGKVTWLATSHHQKMMLYSGKNRNEQIFFVNIWYLCLICVSPTPRFTPRCLTEVGCITPCP